VEQGLRPRKCMNGIASVKILFNDFGHQGSLQQAWASDQGWNFKLAPPGD